jgi:hypothetical protein
MWEAKLVDRERGGYAQKASAGEKFAKVVLSCFRIVRRAYRAPSSQSSLNDRTPLQRIYFILGERMACPPAPENETCLMVFARNPLAAGPGNAWN